MHQIFTHGYSYFFFFTRLDSWPKSTNEHAARMFEGQVLPLNREPSVSLGDIKIVAIV
jgi:hypothetical protein